MGIVAVVDVLITASSIQVRVELHEPHVWQYTDIWCAAYPVSVAPSDDPSSSMNSVHMTATSNPLHVMPPIHFDTEGSPLTSDQLYVVKCRADESLNGGNYHYYLSTSLTTKEPTDECHTGVHWISADQIDAHLYVHGPVQNGAVDLGHTKYYNFPSGIVGVNVFDLPRPIPGLSSIELTCCPGRECEFWVSMYVCPECTGPRENGLRSGLLSSGWDSGSCAPKFDDNRDTVSFHRLIDASNSEVPWTQVLYSAHDEIVVVFGFEGRASPNWCPKVRGPQLSGGGSCFRNGNCPPPFRGGPK